MNGTRAPCQALVHGGGCRAANASQGGVGGVYSGNVTADDGNGGVTNYSFSWTVTNPAPDAVDNAYTTDEDTAVGGNARRSSATRSTRSPTKAPDFFTRAKLRARSQSTAGMATAC